MAAERMDTFVCVHQRDVDYLLGLALRSYVANFQPKGQLTLITNDLPYLRAFIEPLGLGGQAQLSSDDEWLSSRERELPGWFRQQIIKLRAARFCSTENFCNLGADTILLQPIRYEDLVAGNMPVLYYTRHRLPDKHYLYERGRVRAVAQILGVQPERALRYVDFINDFFCFNREALACLNEYLEDRYGPDCYVTLLRDLDSSREADRNKFGEWTLYSVYLLDYLKRDLTLRDTRQGFLQQIHSRFGLRRYHFDTKVAHFVSKDFDIDGIRREIQDHGLMLGEQLQP